MGGTSGDTFLGYNWISMAGLPGWHVAAAADMNRDGRPDVIWQNDTTGQVTVWYMGGTGGNLLQNWAWLSTANMPDWKIVGAADLDSNGTPDLLWQSETTRQVTFWAMSGTQGDTFAGWGWLAPNPVPGWRVVGAVDLNGDLKSDLLWQNDTTQQATAWYLGGAQGASVQGASWIAANGPVGWRLIAR